MLKAVPAVVFAMGPSRPCMSLRHTSVTHAGSPARVLHPRCSTLRPVLVVRCNSRPLCMPHPHMAACRCPSRDVAYRRPASLFRFETRILAYMSRKRPPRTIFPPLHGCGDANHRLPPPRLLHRPQTTSLREQGRLNSRHVSGFMTPVLTARYSQTLVPLDWSLLGEKVTSKQSAQNNHSHRTV